MNSWKVISELAGLNDRVAETRSDLPACILVRDKEAGDALVLLTATYDNRDGIMVLGLILEGENRGKTVGTRTGPFAGYRETRDGGLREEEVVERFRIEDLQKWFANRLEEG